MSRCNSATVFGGSGMPSGVCTVARRSAALRRVGLKLRIPSRARVDFIRFTIRVRSRYLASFVCTMVPPPAGCRLNQVA
jgi:hypothetical protein